MIKYIILFFLSICVLFAKDEYVISIVPQLPSSIVQKQWGPIIDEISRQTDIKFVFKFYPSIPEFEKGFLNGEVDFAYMNPYHAIMAYKAQGYKPILRAQKSLVGILVVNKNSQIQSVKDLDGKEIAFPAPNAFAASLWMRALLTQEEKIDFKPKYVKTHSNVYKEVLLGLSVAGGGVNKTLASESEQVKNGLKIIYTTKPVPSHPIVVKPSVKQEVVDKFKTAMIALYASNSKLFAESEFLNPTPTSYSEYKFIDTLKLEKFVVLEK